MSDEPIVLDSEGLSRAVKREPYLRALILDAYLNDKPMSISAMTSVEVIHGKTDLAALRWVQSRLKVVPVTAKLANEATALLIAAGRHGHKDAIDAVVCATALGLGGVATIYTSDPDDFEALAPGRIRVVPLR